MKHLIILLFFPLIFTGQIQVKLDSLMNLLGETKEDSTKAKTLLNIGKIYLNQGELDKARE